MFVPVANLVTVYDLEQMLVPNILFESEDIRSPGIKDVLGNVKADIIAGVAVAVM